MQEQYAKSGPCWNPLATSDSQRIQWGDSYINLRTSPTGHGVRCVSSEQDNHRCINTGRDHER
eukprot:265191-Amphidinium_carterae.1